MLERVLGVKVQDFVPRCVTCMCVVCCVMSERVVGMKDLGGLC